MPEDINNRLTRLEVAMETMSKELVKINANLETLANIQVEQARAREEVRALFDKAEGTAIRAHERIDRVESNLSRAVWVVLTVVIVASLANIGLTK